MAVLVAGLAVRPRAASADEPLYDGLQQLFDDEARAAMAEANYVRAWHYFMRLLQINPDDARALREAARCAQALGQFDYAERAYARVEALRPGVQDPELWYLRGEALLALGRTDEARAQFGRAEFPLPRGPLDRMGALWLARIYALRGDLAGAESVYAQWQPKDTADAQYAEIMTARAEAHILVKDWHGAEKILRELIFYQPEHVRGREMLAWVMEGRGELDQELELRADLAAERGFDRGGRVLRYARALERAHEYDDALAHYRKAERLGVDELTADIDRLEYLTAPEVAAGTVLRHDPSGRSLGWLTGANLPLGSVARVVVTGTQDGATGTFMRPDDAFSLYTLSGSLVVADRAGDAIAVGASAFGGDRIDDLGRGGTVQLRSRPKWPVQLRLAADANMPWRESVSTIREGGVADAVTGELYAVPIDRLIFSAVGRARRLSLQPMGGANPMAVQLLGAGGVDWIVRTAPGRVARGQIVDDTMLWPSSIATGIMLSYRHYQLASDNPFGTRVVLVRSSAIDELSATAREVFDRRGILAGELTAGAGYDWDREVRQWRAGTALHLSASTNSRLSAAFDASSEAGTGLVGRRYTGWISLHVDL